MRGDFMLQEQEQSLATKHDALKIILVVEDDEDNLELFTLTISSLTPYHIQVARNGSEAIYVVQHIKPSLFILDYFLPRMNGIDLYDQLHTLPGLEHIPAIIISGVGSEKVARDIESRKLIRIEKPYELDDLLNAVKQALG
jgi:CheY-like chemotaxis protein